MKFKTKTLCATTNRYSAMCVKSAVYFLIAGKDKMDL
jgi:hypothetical protein